MCSKLEWWEAVPSAWEMMEELPIPARMGVSVVGLAGDQVPRRTVWRNRHGEPLVQGLVSSLCKHLSSVVLAGQNIQVAPSPRAPAKVPGGR